ncbi:polysaccharide biosynthesis protein [Pengzhenrongella frigida]|uniref:NAD-dependent epimerase/dehydratase family protein n=1 Tax=Pengzhenrongella frigida TaxID=1259133 RepID=A0A4Q5MZP6_9MICO|nr:polysaccharide biosynthesis protein [Cellulomonas sp. HLT2-17]RYV51342.1 NAD-dependent epimerase/dehydratase family protein [Cellulomonas sp. HLT2-17]
MNDEIYQAYHGSRILITGGAGFIGGQTLRLLLALEPAKVVVADTWENGLAELVRDLRSEGAISAKTVFEPRLVDVTSPLLNRVVHDDGPFDAVFAFAAAKHVRTEREPVSALHMLNVNINGTFRALSAAAESNPACRLFMVSTDKAADPSSLMGASKRVMEEYVKHELPMVNTTRFANVAFSSGSLLESWLIRLGRGHALPVPADTTRYFVRPVEAGQLCMLASVAPPGSIVVPADGAVDSVELSVALKRILSALGLTWRQVEASDAEGQNQDRSVARILVTARDTAGEKAAESFIGAAEQRSAWLPSVDIIAAAPPRGACVEVAQWIGRACNELPGPSVEDLLERIHATLPEFDHVTSDRRLDDRI